MWLWELADSLRFSPQHKASHRPTHKHPLCLVIALFLSRIRTSILFNVVLSGCLVLFPSQSFTHQLTTSLAHSLSLSVPTHSVTRSPQTIFHHAQETASLILALLSLLSVLYPQLVFTFLIFHSHLICPFFFQSASLSDRPCCHGMYPTTWWQCVICSAVPVTTCPFQEVFQ